MRVPLSQAPISEPIYQEAASLGYAEPICTWLARSSGAGREGSLAGFLQKSSQGLHDPFLLPDMEIAVKRVARALKNQEQILIHGDFDVDGLSASSVLYWGLRKACRHARPRVFLPHRFMGGHGIHAANLQEEIQKGVSLVITADCGLGSAEAIRELQTQGVDVIITDHHLPEGEIAEACAVVHPRSGSYPFEGLAGVGVAYKFVEALLSFLHGQDSEICVSTLQNCIDYVAMGTIADVMPLYGENRILVSRGLEHMMQSRLPFLKDFWMRRILKLELGESFDEDHIGYFMAPRLNSASRLESAWPAFRFLTAIKLEDVTGYGEKLETLNQERSKRLKNLKGSENLEIIDFADLPVVLIHTHSDEIGLLGLVASQFAEEYGKCALAFGMNPEGLLSGSARTRSGYSLKLLLEEVGEILEGFGGHHQAAGLRLHPEAFSDLVEAIRQVPARRYSFGETEIKGFDAWVGLHQIDQNFVESMLSLGPFGEGNPRPVFGIRDYTLIRARRVGRENRDLSLTLKGPGGCQLNGIGFGLADMQPEMESRKTPVYGTLGFNYFGGRRIQLQLMGFARLDETA